MTAIRHGCTLDEAGLLLQQNTNRQMPTIQDLEGEPFITFSPVEGPYFNKEVLKEFAMR